MTLHLIGYWRTDSHADYRDPVRLIDDRWNADQRDTVADYLDTGTYLRGFMGFSPCRICGKDNGSGEYTDGVLVWPEGLSHYVREHSVRLPTAIEEHVLGVSEQLHTETLNSEWWVSGAPLPIPR